MTEQYIIITGLGRSGTNWLLDMFDLSPVTFCRNEPYGDPDADNPYDKLPSRWVDCQKSLELDTQWDDVMRWTASHIGPRDHPSTNRKTFYRPMARKMGMTRIIYGTRLRRATALFAPSLRGNHIDIPTALFDRASFTEHAVPVMKIITAPGWIPWVLRNRSNVKVIHIARHPGGFLSSYRNRYLADRDMDEVREASRNRLREIATADADWAARLTDIEHMDVDELELWFWRYATECLHEAGRDKSLYRLIRYEDLAADAVSLLQSLYTFCGVKWSQQIEDAIKRMNASSTERSRDWRSRLSNEQCSLISRVLADSELREWWPDIRTNSNEQRVGASPA